MACWPASSAATSGNTMAATTSSSSARSRDRKSTRLNSSHQIISYAVFCLKKEKHTSELQSPDHLVCRLLLKKKNDSNFVARARNLPQLNSMQKTCTYGYSMTIVVRSMQYA